MASSRTPVFQFRAVAVTASLVFAVAGAGLAHAQGGSGDNRSATREAPGAGSTPGRAPSNASTPGRKTDSRSTPGASNAERSTDGRTNASSRSTPGTSGRESRSRTPAN